MLDISYAHEYAESVGTLCQCQGQLGDGAPARAVYRCSDCFERPLLCKACCVKEHVHLPFHRVHVWSGAEYFQQTSLREMGLVVNLNHLGSVCKYYRARPDTGVHTLTVIHTNGLHSVNVRYCRCGNEVAFREGGKDGMAGQLWRVGIWPASWDTPKTGATIAVLRQFRLLTVECKINATSFITFLRRSGAVIREEEFAVSITLITQTYAYMYHRTESASSSVCSVIGHTSTSSRSGMLNLECMMDVIRPASLLCTAQHVLTQVSTWPQTGATVLRIMSKPCPTWHLCSPIHKLQVHTCTLLKP